MKRTPADDQQADRGNARSGQRERTADQVLVSRVVAANVARIAASRGMSNSALARAVQANGHRMHLSTLTRLRLGYGATGSHTAFTVDQLVWLAEALDVSPATLLHKPQCETCLDAPPRGFTCQACGAGADRD